MTLWSYSVMMLSCYVTYRSSYFVRDHLTCQVHNVLIHQDVQSIIEIHKHSGAILKHNQMPDLVIFSLDHCDQLFSSRFHQHKNETNVVLQDVGTL